jgi:Lrp/AsnC family leucine-responsive transcriptional regulator
VRETLTGHRNLYVEAVGTGTADTARISDEMHELGVSVESSEILRQRRVQPFNHFFFTDPYDQDGGE